MTKCRMCSQRLTCPGRLCRECERELDRERAAADGLAAVVELPDSDSGGAGPEAASLGALHSRTVALFAAFGIGIAASAYVVHGTRSVPDAGASVMIGRDLTGITPREVRVPAPPERSAAPGAIAVAHSAAPAGTDRIRKSARTTSGPGSALGAAGPSSGGRHIRAGCRSFPSSGRVTGASNLRPRSPHR